MKAVRKKTQPHMTPSATRLRGIAFGPSARAKEVSSVNVKTNVKGGGVLIGD